MADTINGKRLNMEIDFSANTSNAKKEIIELQKQLDGLMKTVSRGVSSGDITLTKDIQEATKAAASLKAHLEGAINVKTGKLDLGLLNKSFKDAGTSLSKYQEQLNKLGFQGKQAFSTLAQSILKAEVPLKQSSHLLNEFTTTLKNTARWQISSSILHGFMGSLQSAFGYAKDLNESLNNIRIVTGQNVDQMAKFATEANKAAQSLSTTTTAYTDASLIYYQQGLSDEEVKRRTETTIKMANVSRQSAEEVSNQMTSVWNNFNKAGDQSTDHFADIMTALGAKTASSSSEIAEGLSKFAGIADTVGLSFDYAASALATITATSRESADVVGTSLKTIFSRLEGLKLGETLDDGTELNKYSEALEKIGVNIFDANNELKNMDTILEETGQKWQNLTEDQKMATAQTVAGVRQYNQFITLMDNWDFMQQNLQTSKDAEGTLQKQADIYAESWEAARDRVRAAAEEIYSKLLNDDFFIDLNNGFAGALGLISDTIDALGGLKGVLSTVGVLVTQIFGKDIANTIDRFLYNFQDQQKISDNMKSQALNLLSSEEDPQLKEIYTSMLEPQQALLENSERMNELEKSTSQYLIQQQQANAQDVIILKQKVEAQNKIINKSFDNLKLQARGAAGADAAKDIALLQKDYEKISQISQQVKDNMSTAWEAFDSGNFEKIQTLFSNIDTSELTEDLQNAFSLVEEGIKNGFPTAIEEGLSEISNQIVGGGFLEQFEANLRESLSGVIADESELESVVQSLISKMNAQSDASDLLKEKLKELAISGKLAADNIRNTGESTTSFGTKVMAVARGVTSLCMAINTLKGLGSIWSNDDMSLGEKMLSTLTSLGMTIPMVMMGLKSMIVEMGIFGVSSQASFGAAIKGALGFQTALGPLGWVLLGITAAVATVAEVFSFMSDKLDEQNKKVEEAKTAAEELSNEYDSMANSYQNLVDTIADYNNAKEGLKELTRGTVEWEQAVTSLNDKVLQLISAYPELAKEVQNINGVLQLSKAGQEKALDLQQQKIDQSYREKLLSELKVDTTQNRANYVEESRTMNAGLLDERHKDTGDPVSMILGLADGFKEALDNIFEEGTHVQAIENVIDAYKRVGDILFGEVGSSLEESAKSIQEHADVTAEEAKYIAEHAYTYKQLAKEEQKQEKENLLQQKELGRSLVENTEYADTIFADALGSIMARETEKLQNQIDETEIDIEANREKFAEDKGYSYLSEQSQDDTVAYADANGDVKYFKQETINTSVKAKEAIDKVTESTEEYVAVLQRLSNVLDTDNKDTGIFLDFLAGNRNVNDYTPEQIQELKDFSFGDLELTNDELKELGFRTAHEIDEVADSFANEYEDAIDDIKQNLGDENNPIRQVFEGLFNKGKLDKLTGGVQRQLAELLSDSFENKNMIGLQKIGDALSSMTSEEINKVIQGLEDTNLSTEDAFSNLKETFKDLGLNIPDKEIKNLVSALSPLSDKALAASQALNQLQIAKGLTNENDAISIDDYSKLSESQKQYFEYTTDGTYKLIADAKEFQKVVEDTSLEALDVKIQELSGRAGELQQAVNVFDYDTLTREGSNGTVGSSIAQSQLSYLSATGYDQEQLAAWDQSIKIGAGEASGAYKELAEAVKEAGDQTDILKSQLESTEDEIIKTKQQVDDLRHSLDEDVNKEEWKEMASYINDAGDAIKGLSNDVKKNRRESEKLAEAILRYDSALEDVQGNMKEWKKLLKSTNAQDQIKAAQELRNVYSDLLDVDPSTLSDGFLTSTENLQLLEEAAKGSEKAYNELQQKALEDVEAHISLDNTEFWTAKDEVQTALDEMNFQDLEIGAKLDSKGFLDALTQMVNAAGMTATEATSYLSSMGVDAEVETESKTEDIQKSYTNLEPQVNYHSFDNLKVADDGTMETTTGFAPKITYQPVTHPYTETVVGAGTALKVTSANKSSGGKFKFNNASHGSGAAGRTARKPSGGGGGSSSKGSTLNKITKPKDKIAKRDPYWQYNQTIKQTENATNKLARQSEYLFGPALSKNIAKQNALLQVQLENYRALYKEQKHQRSILRRQAKRKKYGAEYDDLGMLANYDEIFKKQRKKFKKAQDDYEKFIDDYKKKRKKGKISEKEKKKLEDVAEQRKEAYENAKKDFETFQKWIDTYQDTTYDIEENKEKREKMLREMIENNVSKWDIEINFDIDTREAERSWNKFIKKASKALQTTMSHFSLNLGAENIVINADEIRGLTKDYQAKQSQYQTYEWIANNYDKYIAIVTDESKRLVSSQSEAAEKARKYKEELKEIGEKVMTELQEGWNEYLNGLDQAQEAFDMINDKLKTQGDILEYNKQMIELVYGDKAYSNMEQYYKTQDSYLKTQQTFYQQQQARWEKEFEEAKKLQAANNSAFDEHDMTTWSDAMIKTYENAQAAAANLRDTNLEYVQNQIDMYNNIVDKEMDAFERSLTGGNLLEEEQEKWERAKKEADLFLDDTERAYQIQTLMNKYDKSINETKEVNAVKQLTKLRQEELNQLTKKGKLTQFDLDVANARYELALKQIALEEAQNNKSTMKLSRNAEGNWTYQYVVNQEDVDAKAQEVLDAENNWYKISKDNQRRTKDEVLSIWSDAISKIKEILKDTNLSMEERQAKANEIANWANNMSKGLSDENYISIQNMLASTGSLLSTAYETDSKSFEQYNKDKMKFINDLKTSGIKDFTELFDSFGIYAEKGAKRFVSALVGGNESDIAALPTIVNSAWTYLTGEENSLSKAFGDAGDIIIGKFVSNSDSVLAQLTGTDGAFPKIDKSGKECWSNISWYITDPQNGVLANFGKVNTALGSIQTDMTKTEISVVDSLEKIRAKIVNELIPAVQEYLALLSKTDEGTKTGNNPPAKVAENITDLQYQYNNIPFTPDAYVQKNLKTLGSKNLMSLENQGFTGQTIDGWHYLISPNGQKVAWIKADLMSLEEAMKKWNNLNLTVSSTGSFDTSGKTGKIRASFATGGYTGSWDGNDGRLAILHQKELVLNANDTKNMLDAVNTIRDIKSLNSSITNSIAKSISGIVAGTAQHMLNGGNITQDVGKNEQYVIENINAEFPNAENVEEIREAIMSLPRLASQYVSRNLK